VTRRDLALEYSNPSPEPYAAGSSGNKRCRIGGRVGLVDSTKEKNKARAVVKIYRGANGAAMPADLGD